MNKDILDEKKFLNHFNDCFDILGEIIIEFKQSVPEILSKIENAIKEKNLSALTDSSHNIKGLCTHFFSFKAKDIAEELEGIETNKEFKKATFLFEELKIEMDKLLNYLDNFAINILAS